ncbi:DNA-directed RNA polymerase subunit beta' [Candidatus Mycoplasma mahonii]|uniref:DNA-directed RNA polymerase subunit beta' n=1 Tax=Candidatus Mycoplasma mahonii TaxID=3004105 RepID=UPI0026F2E785|nr:DNA-directed RNA polymerase subunit beta' [Candidatus Mycoplasma mahonii]WKX02354.1 DNA-directed RNA polymerase subunit beta' [Candidatus Mycoplasma mahonii]
MPFKSRKYATIDENSIKSIRLSLAKSDDFKEWSHGEVTKPETINYKTFKPEKYGLFDEMIFGPITDFKCPICGTKHKRSNEGQICEKTDECKLFQPEILPKSSRRTRMGHIELASPVMHFWFFKIDHSILAKLLGIRAEGSAKIHSKTTIESIIYFKSHIVLESGGLKTLPKHKIIDINNAAVFYRDTFRELLKIMTKGGNQDAIEEINFAIKDLEETASSKIGKDYGIDFYELNEIIEEYSEAKIGTGANAIKYILEKIDLKAEVKVAKTAIAKINNKISKSANHTTQLQARAKLYKRLLIINAFIESKQDPSDMLITNLPVIPTDLRPLVQIDGGRHSTSDVNELYRRIIIKNNRLKKWFELEAPILIIQNELRMLQESVDALIDNSRKKPSPVMSKDNRPLKSISDALTGKKGRFRQNLLGKRVDYSGRSVIVIGPDLKMHQAGIPRQMAAKLFEPWIIKKLVDANVVSSIKAAKKIIEEEDNKIWPFVEETMIGKVVLLNRAPTLHRLSVQAFEPVLVRGGAIKLHALVTTAFNADFDGDQMAVHVPISPEAIREAKELMLANKNILGPKDGEPIINPSQDMILGLYYLTIEKAKAKGEGTFYSNYDQMFKAYNHKVIDLYARVIIPASQIGKEYLENDDRYIISTVGKFIFNQSFPTRFPFIFDGSFKTFDGKYSKYLFPQGTDLRKAIAEMEVNKPFDKKNISKVVRAAFDQYVSQIPKEDLANVINTINAGNHQDSVMKFSQLLNHKGEQLSVIHAQILSSFVKRRYAQIDKAITLKNEGVKRIFEINEKVKLLEKVWFDYTNIVAKSLDNIKLLGFRYSMLSGVTMSIDDIKNSPIKEAQVIEGDNYVAEIQKMTKKGLLTDDERYNLVIAKWTAIKDLIQADLEKVASSTEYNPIFMMMKSGARGNISNFVQLAGMRGLMANNKKMYLAFAKNDIQVRSTVEVPVKSSFLEGLTSYEFYSSTHGARKGLTDTALNTANSGYLTRRLVDVAQNIVVREDDCKSDYGFLVKDIKDTKTNTVIVSMQERIEGRFTNKPVVNADGEVIIERGVLITNELVRKIVKEKIDSIEIRSVLGCQVRHGVCKICYGKDLATNTVVQIGEAVGIVAAQSIGEPGTQLTMRTFHTGGVAGVDDITGGFDRLKQLIDATKKTWERSAVISKTNGQVVSIEYELDENDNKTNKKIISVKATDLSKTNNGSKVYKYKFLATRRIRRKKGEIVKAGSKLVDGPIVLEDLLEYAGPRPVQNYLLKEIQRIYRMQGIAISDKYIEIIIRQMLSKIQIEYQGDSELFAGTLVDVQKYKMINRELLIQGKKPAYGSIILKGAKQTPLLSESFLSAASYQETAKVLVHASISGRRDNLEGLKENIIVGHKIPAGTSSDYEAKGKYDIRDPRDYFKTKQVEKLNFEEIKMAEDELREEFGQ